ncbi:MAG TPA: Flp family type IVb pilin [Candidatus Baltobacteraceae bacterium]|jgi:pilus assembly protein Flp/PilA
MLATLQTFIRDDEGATMVEYGLMVALVAIACIIAVTALGTKLSALFTSTSNDV